MTASSEYILPRLAREEDLLPWSSQLNHELARKMGELYEEITALVTGVSSFNARTGAVVPAVGDYSAFYSPLAHTHSHTTLTNIGTNTHTQIDTALTTAASHIADATIHFAESAIDHTAIQNIGSNSHADIDSHIADAAIHFTEGSIDHTVLQNIGSNSHAAIDSHIADGTIHFTEGSIDHGSLAGLTGASNDDHDQYLLRAGRSGTGNDAILSTSTDGTLTGSTATASDLKLVANSTDGTSGGASATVGYVESLQPLHLLTSGYTFNSGTYGASMTAAQQRQSSIIAIGGGTITLTGSGGTPAPTFRALSCFGTVALSGNAGDPFGMATLFHHAFTYTNTDGHNPGPIYTLVDNPTVSVTTTAGPRTLSAHQGVVTGATYSIAAGANALTVTRETAIAQTGSVGANCLVTDQYGLHAQAPAGTGTITRRTLLYAESDTTQITTDYLLGINAAPGTHGMTVAAATGVGTLTNGSWTGAQNPIAYIRVNMNGTAGVVAVWPAA